MKAVFALVVSLVAGASAFNGEFSCSARPGYHELTHMRTHVEGAVRWIAGETCVLRLRAERIRKGHGPIACRATARVACEA